jgi:hypothetical protein
MGKLAQSNSRLAGKSKTPDGWVCLSTLSGQRRDRDHNPFQHDEQHQSKLRRLALPSWLQEVRKYPSSGGGDLCLCLPCFANENMHRHMRAKQTGRPEDCPQISWSTAEVMFDKHGEPSDAEPVIRQGIINYHKWCE